MIIAKRTRRHSDSDEAGEDKKNDLGTGSRSSSRRNSISSIK